MRASSDRPAQALAVLLVAIGFLHFLLPRPFDEIVPRVLPGPPRLWTYASGVAEISCGLLVARRRTRRLGALLAAMLFVVLFAGNLQMAWDWRNRSLPERTIAYGRLPLQIPLV